MNCTVYFHIQLLFIVQCSILFYYIKIFHFVSNKDAIEDFTCHQKWENIQNEKWCMGLTIQFSFMRYNFGTFSQRYMEIIVQYFVDNTIQINCRQSPHYGPSLAHCTTLQTNNIGLFLSFPIPTKTAMFYSSTQKIASILMCVFLAIFLWFWHCLSISKELLKRLDLQHCMCFLSGTSVSTIEERIVETYYRISVFARSILENVEEDRWCLSLFPQTLSVRWKQLD